jgi:hypothetical protein
MYLSVYGDGAHMQTYRREESIWHHFTDWLWDSGSDCGNDQNASLSVLLTA